MTKEILMNKYPIYSLNITKDETSFQNASEIIDYFQSLIEKHPIASFITAFNHYEHTTQMQDGIVSSEIKDAQNIIFCFGKKLPNSKVLAVRPRSIGVCEFENNFEINFLEVPNEELHTVVENWAKSVINK